ncbi:45 kDa calcium-binding protein, partial [Eschrichtius robustus]|nr:45 kDa calcium-binding protein [Eschrichtius robustus]
VDLNTDRRISAKEMQHWIMEKTAEHFQEAIVESRAHFRAVDPDGDGRVSWDEYKVKFLASKGHDEREVADKIKNKWDLNVDEETQEVLENLRDRWYQADNPPPDLLLTESEFLSFLHPEHSRGMLQFMVKEIIRDLDQDGDKKLSLSEFISLPVGTVENQQGQDVDDGWVRDRKREFEELIDANHDGIVTMAELEVLRGACFSPSLDESFHFSQNSLIPADSWRDLWFRSSLLSALPSRRPSRSAYVCPAPGPAFSLSCPSVAGHPDVGGELPMPVKAAWP